MSILSRSPSLPEVNPNIRTLQDLNASWRFVRHGPRMKKDKESGDYEVTRASFITCEVFDKTTRERYATGTGESEELALEDAAKKAKLAPKPKTLAQKAEESLPLDDRIAAAEKALAELRAQKPAPPRQSRVRTED